MNVNVIEAGYSVYQNNTTSKKKDSSSVSSKTTNSCISTTSSTEVAATYEKAATSSTSSDSTTNTIYTSDGTTSSSRAAIIEQMQADTEQRMANMQSLVTSMFQKQGITIGSADDMWSILASGNFTADADTIAQAKEDISEDGYWGVSQTSDRIVSFAIALSGGDEEKMKEMVSAVEKGFKEATKTWGQELPSISSDTYDAVMSKFDDWFQSNNSDTTTSDILQES